MNNIIHNIIPDVHNIRPIMLIMHNIMPIMLSMHNMMHNIMPIIMHMIRIGRLLSLLYCYAYITLL